MIRSEMFAIANRRRNMLRSGWQSHRLIASLTTTSGSIRSCRPATLVFKEYRPGDGSVADQFPMTAFSLSAADKCCRSLYSPWAWKQSLASYAKVRCISRGRRSGRGLLRIIGPHLAARDSLYLASFLFSSTDTVHKPQHDWFRTGKGR